MPPVTPNYKSLASLTVFRILYQQKDIYDVIFEFIKDLIISNNLMIFNAITIKDMIKEKFNFSLPEAIIKTVLKRNNELFTKENHNFSCSKDVLENITSEFDVNSSLVEEKHQKLFLEIIDFIKKEQNISKLEEEERTKVIESICDYLLNPDGTTSIKAYSDYISAFIISKKNDKEFLKNIEEIREAVILYAGISYCNDFSRVWNTPVTIFLSLEVLFDFAGLNGELFKERIFDLYHLVKDINLRNKKSIIQFKYFRETKNRIESFFNKAIRISRGKEPVEVYSTAMTSILNGNQDIASIEEKRVNLFADLEGLQIEEDENDEYYYEKNIQYNLSSQSLLEQLLPLKNDDITEDKIRQELRILNNINILRKQKKKYKLSDIEYTLVTRDSCILWISNFINANQLTGIHLASKPAFLTTKFWFSLQKGFGSDYPKSFSIISRAQIILSSHFNQSIKQIYTDTLEKYNNGEITQEQTIKYLVAFREYVKKPEDINNENSLKILPISQEKIEQAITERTYAELNRAYIEKELAKKERELNLLKEAYQDKTKQLINYEKKIEIEKKISILKKNILNINNAIKKTDIKISRRTKLEKFVLISLLIVAIIAGVCLNKNKIINLTITIIIPLLTLFGQYIYIISTGRNFNPIKILKNRKKQIETHYYNLNKIDCQQLEKLISEKNTLEKQLEKIIINTEFIK